MGGDKYKMSMIGLAAYAKDLLGNFPKVTTDPTLDMQKTLFVNAWDPWSIVGNGNEGDGSLDGHMGRTTMMGVLCWPGTNREIRYVQAPAL